MALLLPSDEETGDHDPFPFSWLTTDLVQPVIHSSPLGIGLLQAVRQTASEQIIDFQYIMINQVLLALTRLPVEDVLNQFFSLISPDIRQIDRWDRLIQVIRTGRPIQFMEMYQLDGLKEYYHHLYLKSGEGILFLVQDVTYSPLSTSEQRVYTLLLEAMEKQAPINQIRLMFLDLISGHTH